MSFLIAIPVHVYIWGGIVENGWVWFGRFKGSEPLLSGRRLTRGAQLGVPNLSIRGEWVNAVYFGRCRYGSHTY